MHYFICQRTRRQSMKGREIWQVIRFVSSCSVGEDDLSQTEQVDKGPLWYGTSCWGQWQGLERAAFTRQHAEAAADLLCRRLEGAGESLEPAASSCQVPWGRRSHTQGGALRLKRRDCLWSRNLRVQVRVSRKQLPGQWTSILKLVVWWHRVKMPSSTVTVFVELSLA